MERSAETTRDDPDGEYLKWNRWFESGSLQRRVSSEFDIPDEKRAAAFRLFSRLRAVEPERRRSPGNDKARGTQALAYFYIIARLSR